MWPVVQHNLCIISADHHVRHSDAHVRAHLDPYAFEHVMAVGGWWWCGGGGGR